jgi:ribosomal protein L22
MVEEKKNITKEENKVEDTVKKETIKKEVKKEVPKKEFAVARGNSLRISPKQSKYVCKMITKKSPESAIVRLQEVVDEKRAVPMAGLEVAHKRGMAGAKFPKNACKIISAIVRQAAANAIVSGIENPVIVIAKSDRASAPYRRGGRKGKRTNLYIEVREKGRKAEVKK